MKITLIHNAKAGSAVLSRRDIASALEAAGHAVSGDPEGDADVVIAAGGDGTVIEAATRLAFGHTPLCPLPLGTANNIARSLGLTADLGALVSLLEHPRIKRMDAGVAYGAWGTRTFVEGGGVGLFCDAIEEQLLTPADKHPARAAARLRELLDRYEARAFDVAIDGEDLSGRFLLLDVMNVPMFGPNLCLTPNADPFDGYFDVTLVRESDRKALIAYLDALASQRNPPPPAFDTRRARHVMLRLHDSVLRLDDVFRSRGGERSPFADLRIAPAAIPVWLPPR